MNLDLGSFAYGGTVLSGGNTPSWGTSLGQSQPDYKFTYPGADNILIGMMYCAIPLQYVSLPLGKGGKTYTASETSECQLASLFKKVYINETRIDYPFLMVLIREESASHTGRRTIKYSDKIAYNDGINQCNNEEFVKHTRVRLGLAENACWFVYSLEIKNQDELHMYAIVVDANNSVDYPNSQTRRKQWLDLLREDVKILHQTSNYVFDSDEPLQQIFYGSPGTGKSHEVKKQTGELLENGDEVDMPNVFRTTFHPDTDYASFVGCYKPTMKPTSKEEKTLTGKDEEIVYEFVPQVFTDAYVYAYNNSDQPTYLVIEEINRGNCAQIFGDLFQLLDRKNGESEYKVKADKDLAQYLRDQLGFDSEGIQDGKLCLPKNLHILATMNTSDQSLFPMDSAFKRRWDWEYVPINYDENIESGKFEITIGKETDERKYSWVEFIKQVNEKIFDLTQSEDKQMGNFFIKQSIDEKGFKSKVMFYLWYEVLRDETENNKYFFYKKTTVEGKEELSKFTFKDLFGDKATETLQQFIEYLEVAPNENTH